MFLLGVLVGAVAAIVVAYFVAKNNKGKAMKILGYNIKSEFYKAVSEFDDLTDDAKTKLLAYMEEKYREFIKKLR